MFVFLKGIFVEAASIRYDWRLFSLLSLTSSWLPLSPAVFLNAIYKMTVTEYERLMSFIPIFLFCLRVAPRGGREGGRGKQHIDHNLQGQCVSQLIPNFYRVYLWYCVRSASIQDVISFKEAITKLYVILRTYYLWCPLIGDGRMKKFWEELRTYISSDASMCVVKLTGII